jgi:hypothetical protein
MTKIVYRPFRAPAHAAEEAVGRERARHPDRAAYSPQRGARNRLYERTLAARSDEPEARR